MKKVGSSDNALAAPIGCDSHSQVRKPKSGSIQSELYNFELSDEDMTMISKLDKGERISPHPDTFRK